MAGGGSSRLLPFRSRKGALRPGDSHRDRTQIWLAVSHVAPLGEPWGPGFRLGGFPRRRQSRAPAAAPIQTARDKRSRRPVGRVARCSDLVRKVSRGWGAAHMRDTTITTIVVAGWVVLRVLFGLLKAIRDLLTQRAAAWLLPPYQPVTFRVAQVVALAARAIAPKRVTEFDLPRILFAFFPVAWSVRPWSRSRRGNCRARSRPAM